MATVNLINDKKELFTIGINEKLPCDLYSMIISERINFFDLSLKIGDEIEVCEDFIELNRIKLIFSLSIVLKKQPVIVVVDTTNINNSFLKLFKKLDGLENKNFKTYLDYLKGTKLNMVESYQFSKIDEFLQSIFIENGLYKEKLQSMIGLGVGLTPSNDDFLAGFIMAKNVIEKDENFNKLVIEVAKENTNDISISMLSKIVNEDYSILFKNFLISFFSDKDMDKYVDKILEIGATSGVFILIGFKMYIYTKIIINNHNWCSGYKRVITNN